MTRRDRRIRATFRVGVIVLAVMAAGLYAQGEAWIATWAIIGATIGAYFSYAKGEGDGRMG